MYTDPADGQPFYVGKGSTTRATSHLNKVPAADGKGRSKKAKQIRTIWDRGDEVVITIIKYFNSEEAAYDHEAKLIEFHEDTLTNVVRGGGGGRTKGVSLPGDDAEKPIILTAKREVFAFEYVRNGNVASHAYRNAFETRNMKVHTIDSEASKLLGNPEVAARIAQLRGTVRIRHSRTISGICDELDENREMALDTSQPAAANGATMGKARVLGLDAGPQNAPPAPNLTNVIVMSDTELARRLVSIMQGAIEAPEIIDLEVDA